MVSKLVVLENGTLQLSLRDEMLISPSPIGVLVKDGVGYLPLFADTDGEKCRITYQTGEVTLLVQKKDGYHKLVLQSLPEGAERFVFGPYKTAGVRCGEILGASWYADGAVACIQSLMPKIDGGVGDSFRLSSGEPITAQKAAARSEGAITLQCYAEDRSKDREFSYAGHVLGYGGNAKGRIKGLAGPDGRMEGGAVALIGAQDATKLLDVIEKTELAEGLPHPVDGELYAKKSKRVSSAYLIFSGEVLPAEQLLTLAERAGLHCVYFSDLLEKWGHFTVNEKAYPGGAPTLVKLAERAAAANISIGTHNLSNFITTNDDYVTPVPHDGLLVMDETVLTKDVGAADTELFIRDENNYLEGRPLNTVRIGDELITFAGYDRERRCLFGCVRGAYGTHTAAHGAGDTVKRLWDHGYRTLFPDAALQAKMADHLADTLLACGITRTSFDGLEGCQYTGNGNYGTAEFVRRVLERCGENMICDASMTSNYLWHALSYCNWGEPWYDSARRGGNYMQRVWQQKYFDDNLIPHMMGWYKIFDAKGKFEATTPENMEYILSRMAAFDAGIALTLNSRVVRLHGLFDKYLDLIRLWEDFRYRADIPAHVLEKMREESIDWHLERTQDGWLLVQQILHRQDLDYGDQNVETEAGMIYQSGRTDAEEKWKHHSSVYATNNGGGEMADPLHFRIRVGHHGHGRMKDLAFGNLRFCFEAKGGDYLEFRGGTTLLHYDENFNLLEEICGGSAPLPAHLLQPKGQHLNLLHLNYATDYDEAARYELTSISKRAEYHILPKK